MNFGEFPFQKLSDKSFCHHRAPASGSTKVAETALLAPFRAPSRVHSEPLLELSDSFSTVDFSHLLAKRQGTPLAHPRRGPLVTHLSLSATQSSQCAPKGAPLRLLRATPWPHALWASRTAPRKRRGLPRRRKTFYGLPVRTDPKKVSRVPMERFTDAVCQAPKWLKSSHPKFGEYPFHAVSILEDGCGRYLGAA